MSSAAFLVELLVRLRNRPGHLGNTPPLAEPPYMVVNRIVTQPARIGHIVGQDQR